MKKYLLLILLCALLAGCAAQKTEAPELLTPVGAQTDSVVAEKGDMEDMICLQGVSAVKSEKLYFESDAVIAEICVPLGGFVNEGDVVVKKDTSAITSKINALEAELEAAEETAAREQKQYEIERELMEIDMRAAYEDEAYDIETQILLLQKEYENSVSAREERKDEIEGMLEALNDQLEGTSLTSPVSGRLVGISANPGMSAKAYSTVCVITDEASRVIQIPYTTSNVLENAIEIYALQGDKKIALSPLPVDDSEYARTVLRGGTYYTEFEITDGQDLPTGTGAAVIIVTSRAENVLKIPLVALHGDADEYYVYVTDGESRSRRDVSAGLITATEAEITSGLEEGESVYVGS